VVWENPLKDNREGTFVPSQNRLTSTGEDQSSCGARVIECGKLQKNLHICRWGESVLEVESLERGRRTLDQTLANDPQ